MSAALSARLRAPLCPSGHVSSLATKLVLAAAFILFVVLENSYGATFAAHLTVQQLQTSVQNLGDLRGQAVGTVAAYTARLARQGIGTIGYSPDSIHVSWARPGWCRTGGGNCCRD